VRLLEGILRGGAFVGWGAGAAHKKAAI